MRIVSATRDNAVKLADEQTVLSQSSDAVRSQNLIEINAIATRTRTRYFQQYS